MKSFEQILYWPTHNIAPWAAIWPEALGDKSCENLLSKKNGGYFSLNFVQCGTLSLRLGCCKEQILGAGSLFAIRPAQHYCYQGPACRLRWIRLAGPHAEAHLNAMGMNAKTQQIPVSRPDALLNKFDELEKLGTNHTTASDAEGVALLVRMIPDCSPSETAEPESSLARRIRNFMYDDLELGYNVSQIADFFGISRSSMFLHFKREFGTSPVKVLQEARLDKARHLLKETGLTAEEIARACGYSNLSHFMHQFKAAEGCTSSTFRGIRQ